MVTEFVTLFKLHGQMERCGFENDCGNTLENLKENKSHTSATQWWTLIQAEAGDKWGLAEPKQAGSRGMAAQQAR